MKKKLIGYDEENKAYLLIDLETRQMVRAKGVRFKEGVSPDYFRVDSVTANPGTINQWVP